MIHSKFMIGSAMARGIAYLQPHYGTEAHERCCVACKNTCIKILGLPRCVVGLELHWHIVANKFAERLGG